MWHSRLEPSHHKTIDLTMAILLYAVLRSAVMMQENTSWERRYLFVGSWNGVGGSGRLTRLPRLGTHINS